MTDVVYVTHEVDPDEESPDVDVDLEVALSAFSDAGIDWEVAAWDDRGYDWSNARLVLVRSPWDYVPRRDQFVAWAHSVARATTSATDASMGSTRTMTWKSVRYRSARSTSAPSTSGIAGAPGVASESVAPSTGVGRA